MNSTSISLLGRACSGAEPESWDRLTSIYQPMLCAWMRRYSLQQTDVDDLVQEVLLTVYRELPSFRHSGRTGAFRSWLRTILAHRLQQFWRARRLRPTGTGQTSLLEDLNALHDEASDASRIWNAEHDRHVIAQLLEHVRPRFQEKTWEAFRRQMLDGERADAVAASLGMPIEAVYVARSRVLKALRQEADGLVDC